MPIGFDRDKTDCAVVGPEWLAGRRRERGGSIKFLILAPRTTRGFMFLTKIKRKESGVLLYGITPPKAQTSLEKVREMVVKSLNILCSLDIDALVVYDVQEE